MSRLRSTWSVVPDREGQTTVLGACVLFGVPYRRAHRIFTQAPVVTDADYRRINNGRHDTRLGRADPWGVWWAPVSVLSKVLGKAPAAPVTASAIRDGVRQRLERLRQEVGNEVA